MSQMSVAFSTVAVSFGAGDTRPMASGWSCRAMQPKPRVSQAVDGSCACSQGFSGVLL